MHRGLLSWGVFFLVLGAVPLAVRSGVVDAAAFDRAWQLWPLLLIGAGVGLVLARTRGAVVGGLVVAVTAGLIVGGVVVNRGSGLGFPGAFPSCGAEEAGTPFADQRGMLGPEARISLQLDCGGMDVNGIDGSRWLATGSSHDGRPPTIETTGDGLAIASPRRSVGVGLDGGGAVAWTIGLPRDARATLDVSVNAGAARIVLDGLRLGPLTASVNAGSATIDLGNAAEVTSLDASVNAGSLAVTLPALPMTGTVSANAGSLAVCVPDGVNLRIRLGDNALGSNNFEEAGLVEQGDEWTTRAPDPGAASIDLDASANLGSISLNPADGCGQA